MERDARCEAWRRPAHVPRLSPGEVQVWRARLERPRTELERLAATLSPAEAARADRFVFGRHRTRFIVSRATLREILSAHAGIEPAALTIVEDDGGKPRLADRAVLFNVSHSREIVVYALALDREVGVDVEAVKPAIDIDGIGARFFSEAERRSLESTTEQARAGMFFRIWTRKEAVLKAAGTGITHELSHFAVSGADRGPIGPVQIVPGRGAAVQALVARELTLIDLDVAPGFAGALAVADGAARCVDRLDHASWSARRADP